MYQGPGTVKQSRGYHGTRLAGALSILKSGLWTLPGGAGCEEVGRKFGLWHPVAYLAPSFETAAGYATSHGPEKMGNGPGMVCNVECWVEHELDSYAENVPALLLRLKRAGANKKNSFKGEQWLVNPLQVNYAAVWVKTIEPTFGVKETQVSLGST